MNQTPKPQREKPKNPRSLEFNSTADTTIEPNTAESTRTLVDSSFLASESDTSSGTRTKRKRDVLVKPKKNDRESSSDSSQKVEGRRFKTPWAPKVDNRKPKKRETDSSSDSSQRSINSSTKTTK